MHTYGKQALSVVQHSLLEGIFKTGTLVPVYKPLTKVTLDTNVTLKRQLRASQMICNEAFISITLELIRHVNNVPMFARQ